MIHVLAEAGTIPGWAVQLGIATPFILALAYVGRWLLNRLKDLEQEKTNLYDRLMDDVLPALKSSTDAAEKLVGSYQQLADERHSVAEQGVELRTAMAKVLTAQQEAIAFQEELRRRELAIARAQRRNGGG